MTMSEIARKCGVSKMAVSFALRNSPGVSPKTRKKILECARKNNYRAHPIVSHLMSQLRRSHPLKAQALLAIINANTNPRAFRDHPTIPVYVRGIQKRAHELGYDLEHFWLHDPSLPVDKLLKTFYHRNIRGIVLTGLMDNPHLHSQFHPLWAQFPAAITGVRTENPTLPFACVDHYITALHAFRNARSLGYQKPALVLDGKIHELIQGRFTAGYKMAQDELPKSKQIPPFFNIEEANKNRSLFHHWMKKWNPDVILMLYNDVRHWVEEMEYKVPQEIGLIQLDWRADRKNWAGMNQHNDLAGEAAVDMVISQLHSGQTAQSTYPRAALIPSSWENGSTVLGEI